MKLYIVESHIFDNVGIGYVLISEDGEGLASCLCNTRNRGTVKRAMFGKCPVSTRKEWLDKYGEYKILFVGDDDITKEELIDRNKWFYKETDFE